MSVSRTETLSMIAGHIEEIVAIADMMPSGSLASDLHRIADMLRELLMFIADLPEALDETSSWWPEWSVAQATLRDGPSSIRNCR